MSNFVNGAPLVMSLGTEDKSIRAQIVEPEVLPTHLPKVYIYAQKGPTKPQLVVGASRDQMYGTDTFDVRMPWANHATVLSNIFNAQGNAQMIERVLPADIGPKSNFLLSLDLLPTQVTQYQRAVDGKLVLDSNTGLPLPILSAGVGSPAVTETGYVGKWVISSVLTKGLLDTDDTLFGVGANAPGDQTDGPTQSTRYPIMQFWANSEGSYFNNGGFRLSAPTTDSSIVVNSTVASAKKVYPFRLSAIRRTTPVTSPKIVETESGETSFDFCLKPGVINPATDAQFYLGDTYLDKYQSIKDKRFAPKYADFGGFKLYQSNIDTVLGLLYTAELAHYGATGSDFTIGATDEKYLYNMFTGVSTSNVPYFNFTINSSAANSVRLTDGTNIFAKGGTDGTMTDALFNGLVASAVEEYSNLNSVLMDDVIYPESILYDSGFSLATKQAMCKFISVRKDTAVTLATYEVGGQQQSASEEHSIAVSLRTKLQMYPDSDYFGTPVVRGVIVGRNGILRNSLFTKRLPLTLELAHKAAKMMGAGNGKWKPEYIFDKAPNNQVELFDDVNISFTSAMQRNKDWDVGLNYVMSFSRNALYLPAVKTVYTDDSSVLNSFFTMMACIELQKVGQRVHRLYTGSTTLSNAQLIERVNSSVENQTIGRFADMFRIVPAAYISAGDDARGYSWTLPIKIYANNMKTVMTLSVQAFRMTDFTAAV